MSISMSTASLPILNSMLANLSHFLDKGAAYAEAKKFDAANLVQSRLAPDMLPLSRQVQMACDAAKNGMWRLTGIEPPRFEDTEKTIPELKERIQKTLDWLATLPVEKLDGTEASEVTFPIGKDRTRTMTREDYLRHWMLPNFFFHVTTAYAVLRADGVELGKSDYLAGSRAKG
ncbi:MAG: DUF1993 domain-containing protein [Burkholderiaceae bacterium]